MIVKEADMDFRIPRSVVKHAQKTSVRQLIQKIEWFNPFSPESKQMVRNVGNIELCELLETEPKTQCKVCLLVFINWTMDHLSVPEYIIEKDDLMDIDMKEYHTATQLNKRCKKKFQNPWSIHTKSRIP